MQAGWRTIAKTVAATALVTTTFWFVVGAWYLKQSNSTADKSARPPAVIVSEPAPSQASGQASSGRRPSTTAPTTYLVPNTPPGRLAIPVVGVASGQLIDTFAQAREEGARRHDAIDIMAPRGTPVIAAASGKVEKLFLSDAGGKTVYVRSPDRRLVYYYAHLDRYAPSLREGQTVKRGDPIGTVGSTGNANPDGPHLHFAVWRMKPDADWFDEGLPINPYGMLARD
ncbi:M23 family metallopeptidase [Novosphingobium aquimarinum]|uniref:M23 family metallopeptidase n=1 Tax=Novosphingobium aquimarinum TaxID=2682494 RepID=UPI0012EC5C7F|nr:M23 family metallopeptidase [Novosphingobium aquimarinum]